MKALDEILEELLKSKYSYMDERVKLSKLSQARTAILSLMKSIVPEELLVRKLPTIDDRERITWNAYRKEMLRRIDE